MLASTVSPLELAWTILGVLGFCFSLSLSLSAGCDMLTVEEAIQADPPTAIRYGPRWWLALSPAVSNLALCLIWIGYIYLGTRAMADPQITYPPELRGEQTLFGAILLGSEVILLAVQIWHTFIRQKVEHAQTFQQSRRKQSRQARRQARPQAPPSLPE
jgi:4-hydroxybenzoate polyprenyltransferase